MMKKILYILTLILTASISAFAGQGGYLEYKMAMNNTEVGHVKTYYQDGNTRSEVSMVLPGMPGGGNTAIVSLYKKDMPNTVYMLNTKEKTYTETTVNKTDANKEVGDYEITVVGTETVNGYKSTHVKVTFKKSKHSMDMWTSKDITNYKYYDGVKSQYVADDNFASALKAKGAEGVPVRIAVTEAKGQIQMDLVKVDLQDVPASMFSLDGYTKSTQPSYQELMKNMQNMTPEERKAAIEKLKQQYQRQ